MNARDKKIAEQFPDITTHVTHGKRWVPLRLALETAQYNQATEIVMNNKGMFMAVPHRPWVHWSADLITQYRNNGVYAVPLMKLLCQMRRLHFPHDERTK